MALTSNDRVRTQFNELGFELRAQPLDVIRLSLVRSLEALRIRRRDVVEMVIVEDRGIRRPARGVVRKGERRDSIPVEGQLPRDKVGALRLACFLKILHSN